MPEAPVGGFIQPIQQQGGLTAHGHLLRQSATEC